MIQRIQSLYLLLSALVLSSLFFFKIADLPNDFDLYLWKLTDGIKTAHTILLPLSFLTFLSILFSVGTIFFYKNRSRQTKLCFINFIIILILMILTFWLYPEYILAGRFGHNLQIDYNFTIFFPIASIFLILLANSAIKKGDRLVKSSERLR